MALLTIGFFTFNNSFSKKNTQEVIVSKETQSPNPTEGIGENPIAEKDRPVVTRPEVQVMKPANPSTQTQIKSVVLQKASKGGKYGFKDANSGVWIVPPQYKLVTAFSGGLAAVQDFNYKWGYLNEQGKLVIPNVIDQPTKFGNKKRVRVMINAEWVTINKMGKVQVGDRIMDLSEYVKSQ